SLLNVPLRGWFSALGVALRRLDGEDRRVRVGVSLIEAGGLGAASRIDVSTHPPTVQHVEYHLSSWCRDDLLACGLIVLVSDRLARQLEDAKVRGIELIPATTLPPDPSEDEEEPLPANAPRQYRWIKETSESDPDLRIVYPDYIEVSPRVEQLLRAAQLPNADISEAEDDSSEDPGNVDVDMKQRATRAVINGTHGPESFDGLAVVEAFTDAADGEQEQFATVTDALTWARARARQVLVHADDATWSAGEVPHPPYDPLPDDALRRADARALADRERGLAEILVHPDPRPWYLVVIAPETTLELNAAEELVRDVEGVEDLQRHRTRGGEPAWLVTLHAASHADIEALSGRIASALLTPDRLAHLADADTFMFSAGRTQESGLLEHLDLDQLLASHVAAPQPYRPV
ncbi:MAG: hypothetical protein Q7T71_02435, partial [Herbiconiux sp.]|nr:hypothetical protein [Herbiconiux sp.]